jgi:hypothetical protein
MAENVGIATLALTQGISSFTFFLPRITEVRKASQNDPQAVADIRIGEAAGVVVCFGVGAICSALTQSSAPAIVSLVVALMLVALYETVLRSDPQKVSTGSNVVDLIRR